MLVICRQAKDEIKLEEDIERDRKWAEQQRRKQKILLSYNKVLSYTYTITVTLSSLTLLQTSNRDSAMDDKYLKPPIT